MKETTEYELLEALAIARWQMLLNSMRADRSKRQDMIAKIVVGLIGAVVMAILGLSIASITYGMLGRGQNSAVAFALWSVFVLWLVMQVLANVSGGLNFREIARYPITFRLFCLMQAAYALVEPATAAALFLLACAWLAVLFRRPSLAGRAALVMAGFAVVMLLLTRLFAEVVERITSTKKGRRRLIATMIGFTFFYQFLVSSNRQFRWNAGGVLGGLGKVFGYLPPAIAGRGAQGGELLTAAGGLAVYVAILGLPLLWIYLRKYEGELLSDAPARGGKKRVPRGWQFPLLSSEVSALLEKEIRYTLSQPLGFLNCAYGPLMAALMAMGMGRNLHMSRDFLFPATVGWVILMVGSRAYNSFGFDIAGFDRYLLAPPNMRQVVASKNLLVALLLAMNFLGIAAMLAWIAPFPARMFFGVLAALLFATLTTLSAGNLLSVWFPMGIDLETLRARNASTTGQLGNIATQMMIVGTLAVVFYMKLPALPVFVALTIASGALYWSSLDSAVRYAESHSEDIARSLGGPTS
jgi:hypothetical protein